MDGLGTRCPSERSRMAQRGWQELCELVKSDDGLPTRNVGEWSEDKLHFWHKYIQTTTSAMVGKPQWSAGLVYVDLFAGPGVCTIRDTGRRIPGSPLIAAYAAKPFSKILLAELDPNLAEACRARMASTPAMGRTRVFEGDSNTQIHDIVKEIPSRALTLAFIDPEALDARFETVKILADRGQVDLLILFADAYDVVRNVDRYEADLGSKLDQTLGLSSNWRERWAKIENRSSVNVREFFSEIYEQQLRSIGYRAFGRKTISSRKGPLYRLIYASKHERGADFWNKVIARDRSGQSDLFT